MGRMIKLVGNCWREEGSGAGAGAVNKKKRRREMAEEDGGGERGGVYVPRFKQLKSSRMAMILKRKNELEGANAGEEIEEQMFMWDALRKSINHLVNKVNASNLQHVVREMFSENIIRGRGLLCRSLIKSQLASPSFSPVFAALVAVINSKFPQIGLLLLKRIVLQLKRSYKRNDKPQLLSVVKFLAHLVNQQVAHELIALEFLTVLLDDPPTPDGIEVAVAFLSDCGSTLSDISPSCLGSILDRFRAILHEGTIDKRVQFLIEGLFASARHSDFPAAIAPELDLVEPEDQLTHEISLSEDIDAETSLDVFVPYSNSSQDDARYDLLKRSILRGEDDDGDTDDDLPPHADAAPDYSPQKCGDHDIIDDTGTDLVNLRRIIYLTIMSSCSFEEAGHKLLSIGIQSGQETELCSMLLECCSQERTYLRYYGLLGQRLCLVNAAYRQGFDLCFAQQYLMIHRLETNKVRNVSRFFANLLAADALPWQVLSYVCLTEEDTNSSSRIFLKILFQEISELLGLPLLNIRLAEPSLQESLESIFPKDTPKNTRFSINFFTSIGLGGITDNLRDYLKNLPCRLIKQQQEQQLSDSEDDETESFVSSSSSDVSSSYDSDSDREQFDGSRKRKKSL